MDAHIVVSAGEASGDILAAGMIRALRAVSPDVVVSGVGGPAMESAGAKLISHYAPLAVMGHWEALKNLPAILKLRRRLLSHMRAKRPALFVGVDAPDFNLDIAEAARRMGMRTAQYVSPTVWMWRRERLGRIARAANEVWCLFPFEPPIYAGTQTTARFVGHPAADAPLLDLAEARQRLGLERERRPVAALFPGSREAELRRHLPLFAATMRAMPEIRFIAAAADKRAEPAMREGFAKLGVPVSVFARDSRAVFAAADAALVKSGTATLEGALCLTPMAAVYKLGAGADLLRRLFNFHMPYAALPNILAGRFAMPEFLLGDAVAANVTPALRRLLLDQARRDRMRRTFSELRGMLARNGSHQAAAAALNLAWQAKRKS